MIYFQFVNFHVKHKTCNIFLFLSNIFFFFLKMYAHVQHKVVVISTFRSKMSQFSLKLYLILNTLYFFFTFLSQFSGLKIKCCKSDLNLLFLIENICCGYSKEPSHWDGSFEHPQHIFRLTNEKIITILGFKLFPVWNIAFFFFLL